MRASMMRDLLLLAVQLIVTLAKLARPGDAVTIPQGAGRSEVSPPSSR